jgi:hypothetical protein
MIASPWLPQFGAAASSSRPTTAANGTRAGTRRAAAPQAVLCPAPCVIGAYHGSFRMHFPLPGEHRGRGRVVLGGRSLFLALRNGNGVGQSPPFAAPRYAMFKRQADGQHGGGSRKNLQEVGTTALKALRVLFVALLLPLLVLLAVVFA